MKILAIHNFHRSGSASGDDQDFKAETALLEQHGRVVVLHNVASLLYYNYKEYESFAARKAVAA